MLVLLFVVAGALRDVFFGEVFQRHRFFDVVFVSFALATIIFTIVVAVRMPAQFAVLARNWRTALIANLGTACAWLSYFFALKMLEPAVVTTIHAGIGAITLVALNALGLHISRPVAVRRLEKLLHVGIFAVLLTLAGVVLAGLSGIAADAMPKTLLGLAFAFASGIFISLTSDVTKRMHEHGVGAEAVLAVRFIVMIGVAASMSYVGTGAGMPLDSFASVATIAGAALGLIVLPLYVLQLGLVRTSAVTTWIVMALGPCLVFVAQGLDGRIATSPYTLSCIVAYSVLVIAANVARARGTAASAQTAARAN